MEFPYLSSCLYKRNKNLATAVLHYSATQPLLLQDFNLSTVNKMIKYIGGCVVLILITIPAFGATSAPSKRSPAHCEYLKEDKDVDLCYHAVVDNDGSAYCDHECHTVLQEFTRCAGNSTWSQRDQQIKALDESCVLGQTDGAATAQGAISLALAVIGTLAAVIN